MNAPKSTLFTQHQKPNKNISSNKIQPSPHYLKPTTTRGIMFKPISPSLMTQKINKMTLSTSPTERKPKKNK